MKPLSEYSPRADRPNKLLSACKSCRAAYYKSKRPVNTRLSHKCKLDSYRWHAEKRQTRTKMACLYVEPEWDYFFFSEIHSLRRLRDNITNIKWHVDHIIPLHNERVCGLHYWKNMQLLPAILNWRKNNAFYD